MTFGDIVNLVRVGVDRDDLDALYPVFVRQAAHQIQKDHSWRWMQRRDTLTLPAGETTLPLSPNFKEFPTENNACLSELPEDSDPIPWNVWAEAQLQRMNAQRWASKPAATLDWSNDQAPALLFPSTSTDPRVFRVVFYGFLAPLVNDNDENALTRNHNLALVNKAKAIAFESVADPVAQDFEALYNYYFQDDRSSDKGEALKGRKPGLNIPAPPPPPAPAPAQ